MESKTIQTTQPTSTNKCLEEIVSALEELENPFRSGKCYCNHKNCDVSTHDRGYFYDVSEPMTRTEYKGSDLQKTMTVSQFTHEGKLHETDMLPVMNYTYSNGFIMGGEDTGRKFIVVKCIYKIEAISKIRSVAKRCIKECGITENAMNSTELHMKMIGLGTNPNYLYLTMWFA